MMGRALILPCIIANLKSSIHHGGTGNLTKLPHLFYRLFPGDGQTSTLDPANQNQTDGPVHPFHPKIIVRRGVLSTECSEIMQQFFQLRRKKKQRPESPPRAHHSGHHHHPIKFFTKVHHMFGTVFCL
jgi:tRNA(adenine34) deaminase